MGLFIFRGGYGSPYRAPCAGWATPRKVWLGGPWQHYRGGDSAYPAYKNTTLVPNPMCGNQYTGMSGEPSCASCGYDAMIPPFQIPRHCGGGAGDVSCAATPTTCTPFISHAGLGCGAIQSGPDITGLQGDQSGAVPLTNTFALKSPPSTVNKTACRKTGFKNVFAFKNWHGIPPYEDLDKCANCPAVPAPGPAQVSPTSFRYRTITWIINTWLISGGVTTHQDYTGTITVDRLSGKTSGTFDVHFYGPQAGGPPPDLSNTINDAMNGIRAYSDADYCSGAYVGTSATVLNGGDPSVTIDLGPNISPTTFEVQLHEPRGAATFHIYVKLTRSDAYTSDELNTDVNNLLAQWDMSNDALYPWRQDNQCTMGPKVNYWEKVPTPTTVPILAGPPVPAYFSGPGITGTVTGTFTDGDGNTGPYSYSYDGTTADSEWSGTLGDTFPGDGRILGAPNPYGPGADAWFDNRHATYAYNGTSLAPQYYGAYAPCWCPSATQWTDDGDGMFYFPGAFAAFGPGMINSAIFGSPGLGDVLLKAKWAEVILLTTPSINYGRPWGRKDALTRDQTTVDCTNDPAYNNQYGNLRWPTCPGIAGRVGITAASNASPIVLTLQEASGCRIGDKVDVAGCLGNTAANGANQTISAVSMDGTQITLSGTTGNGAYGGGGVANTTGAPAYQWNDNQPKGDWCLLTWTNELRNGGGLTTTVDQKCSNFLPCCPAVVYITPQDGSQPVGETNGSKNSQTFGTAITNIAVDHCYGNLNQMIPKQWMTDLWWQKPVKPCDKSGTMDDGDTWAENNGDGMESTTGPPGSGITYEFYPQRPWVECRKADPAGAPATGLTYNATVTTTLINDPGTQAPIQLGAVGFPNVAWAWMVPWIWAAARASTVAHGYNFACDYSDPMAVCTDDSEVTDM